MSRGGKYDGDERLSQYMKRLRAPVRKPLPDAPLFRQILIEVWEQIYELGKKGNQVPAAVLYKLIPRRSEHIQASLWALEKANKITIDHEKKLITVVFS